MGEGTLDKLLNFHQFSTSIASSGQPGADQFRDIADHGYVAVINLAMPDADNALADEGSIVTGLGMSYFHIPVPFDNPTLEHLKKFIGVMDILEGEKVFVHCALNMRVSVFLYQYLTIKKGLSTDESTSPLLAAWQSSMPEVWRQIMLLNDNDLG